MINSVMNEENYNDGSKLHMYIDIT